MVTQKKTIHGNGGLLSPKKGFFQRGIAGTIHNKTGCGRILSVLALALLISFLGMSWLGTVWAAESPKENQMESLEEGSLEEIQGISEEEANHPPEGDEVPGEFPRFYDQANLIDEHTEKKLQRTWDKIAQDKGYQVIFATTDDAQGKNARDYSDDFLDALFPEERSAALLMLDMDNRQIMLITEGEMIDVIRDVDEESVYDAGIESVKDGDYDQAFREMSNELLNFVLRGRVAGQYRRAEKEPNTLTESEVKGSLVWAFVSGLAFYLKKRKSYKFKAKPIPFSIAENCGLALGLQQDLLLKTNLNQTRIPRDTGSGSSGGSSTHTSSSGHTHGGGHGRGF